jgi:hypothetical protein
MPLLAVETKFPDKLLLASLHQALKISLTSAAQMILSLSIFGAEYVWGLDTQDQSSFPSGPFHADPDAMDWLFCAVDSTWISHTFAVTFLALCYIRGIIDGWSAPQMGCSNVLNSIHRKPPNQSFDS